MMQNNTGKAVWVSTAGGGGLKDVSGHLVKLWIGGGASPGRDWTGSEVALPFPVSRRGWPTAELATQG